MYQRRGEIFDSIFYDPYNNEWIVDGVCVKRGHISDVYHQFLSTPYEIKTVEEIWKSMDSTMYDEAKRLIFALAIKQPGIHPMIVAFYLLALKHNCLQMFQCAESLSEYALEGLLPFDVRLIFIDVSQMVEFYNKYGTHNKASKNFNKIKLPPDFPKP